MAKKLEFNVVETRTDMLYDKRPVSVGEIKHNIELLQELLKKYSGKIYELETRIEKLEKLSEIN